MNLESQKSPKITPPTMSDDFDLDFEFKPITSGLGFHQKTTTEIKPTIIERTAHQQTIQPKQVKPVKADMSVYQNDLSIFYGQAQEQLRVQLQEKIDERPEKTVRTATSAERIFAYVLDLFLIASVLSVILMLMARATDMDLMVAWSEYPNEITPLAVTLFVGFYLMYFSIFEKSSTSTLGKGLLGIRVVDDQDKDMRFIVLVLRSFISLANFVSLGLFSWFDLQNKATKSKVIRND